MKKVTASIFTSIDGVMEAPENWSIPYFNEEAMELANRLLFDAEALLIGRKTYEAFAGAWPKRSEDADDFTNRMNDIKKYVPSTTVGQDDATWNATILSGDLVSEVTKLKEGAGGDLFINGGGEVLNALLRAGLVDDLYLWVIPVVVGSGKKLFSEGESVALQLAEATPFKTGTVILHYTSRQS